MKPVLQLYSLCLTDLGIDDEYWVKVEEELMKKEMYKDDTRRKNRLDNLKLMKVQEILFDEFINQLKEPKMKKKSKKEEELILIEEIEEEIKEVDYEGDMKVIDSKVKKCITYKIIIKDKNKKVVYKDEGEMKEGTKENIIENKLKEIYKKIDKKMRIKLNNKKFIKEYKLLIAKYRHLENLGNVNRTDVGIAKMIGEITNNKDLIEIKNRIILEE
jgi:methionyl-tRNA formyltransferase